ncbi:MAG: mitochondrial fission ELM1 family protein [Gammaproteobacteria bacterium]
MPATDVLTIWRFIDAKRGHENQSLGLARAIVRLTPARIIDIDAHGFVRAAGAWLRRRMPDPLPPPQLAIGAGRATHWDLLAARRAGARTVVLMRPLLPLSCFDLALVPAHDDPPARANVERTLGALNTLRPAPRREDGAGVILIGGPSPHFDWSEDAVLAMIRAILARDANLRWTIADSRRTPASMQARLAALGVANAEYRPHQLAAPGWLASVLAGARRAWVSADSVSMLYEALTAGAEVGVLDLPLRRDGRVQRGLQTLAREGWITPYARWAEGATLALPPRPLAEADRCARLVLDRWFPARLRTKCAHED